MRDRYEEFKNTGFQIVIITPSNRALLEQFVEVFGPFPFPIYGDPGRKLYHSMGHVTMEKWKLLTKAAGGFLRGGMKAFLPDDPDQRAVVKQSMKTQDVYIQGGTWLFDETGNIIWNHIDTSPEKHASIDEVLQKMKLL